MLPASAILDTNSNSLSDLWERAYNGGKLFPSTDFPYGPQDDPDGDGWTNEQEAAAGTNPFVANAPDGFVRPLITHIPEVLGETPESLTISWPTIVGKQYTLMVSPDLVEWLPVEALIGNGNPIEYGITLPEYDKLFWRVKIEDVDSDGDGLTDAEEALLHTDPHNAQTIAGIDDVWLATNFANTLLNGGPAAIDLTDDPDHDGSNNLQEYQSGTNPNNADSDGDGIPDGEDAAPKDGSIAWAKTRPTRYALFDVPLETNPNDYANMPIGVNSQGMVLFKDGVDYRDSFQPLPFTGITWAWAHAINDAGVILGSASFVQGDHEVTCMSVWPSLVSQPTMVAEGGFLCTPTYGMVDGFFWSFCSAIGNDGSFVADSYELVHDEDGSHYEDRYPEVWTRASSGTFTHAQANTLSLFCKSADTHWGWNQNGHEILEAPSGGGDLGLAYHDKYNLIGGEEQALTGGYSPSLFRVNNAWITSPTLGYVIDISDTGIAHVATAPTTENMPNGLAFWMNGHFLHLHTLVPDLPQIYQDWPNVSIPGMADNGTLVLQLGSGSPLAPSACAVGVPCAVEEDVSDAVRLAYRDDEQDTVPFTGVDDVSITADNPNASPGQKIWIMAPLGSEAAPNDVKFHIPVSAGNPMTLSGTNVDGEHELTADGQSVALQGTGSTTTDAGLVLKHGTRAAQNSPIGIKAMKRRTVKVTVTPVAIATPHNHPLPYPPETVRPAPTHQPDWDRLEKYLNKVYQLQVNAKIELTHKPQVTLDFSKWERSAFLPCMNKPASLPEMGDFTFDASTSNQFPSPEEQAFIPLRDPNVDINVYLLAGTGIVAWGAIHFPGNPEKTWIGIPALGIAKKESREVWVDGDFLCGPEFGYGTGDQLTQKVMNTIAHEMGHVIVGDGHPDEAREDLTGGGPAPLPGTNRLERLMVAGGGPDRGKKMGTRLVKGEWDTAEDWLEICPYPPITPNQ